MRSPESPIAPFVKPFKDTAMHLPRGAWNGTKETAKNALLFPFRAAWKITKTGLMLPLWLAGNIRWIPGSNANIIRLGHRIQEVSDRARMGVLFERPRLTPSDVTRQTRESISQTLAA